MVAPHEQGAFTAAYDNNDRLLYVISGTCFVIGSLVLVIVLMSVTITVKLLCSDYNMERLQVVLYFVRLVL